jgi:hypothetical protein
MDDIEYGGAVGSAVVIAVGTTLLFVLGCVRQEEFKAQPRWYIGTGFGLAFVTILIGAAIGISSVTNGIDDILDVINRLEDAPEDVSDAFEKYTCPNAIKEEPVCIVCVTLASEISSMAKSVDVPSVIDSVETYTKPLVIVLWTCALGLGLVLTGAAAGLNYGRMYCILACVAILLALVSVTWTFIGFTVAQSMPNICSEYITTDSFGNDFRYLVDKGFVTQNNTGIGNDPSLWELLVDLNRNNECNDEMAFLLTQPGYWSDEFTDFEDATCHKIPNGFMGLATSYTVAALLIFMATLIAFFWPVENSGPYGAPVQSNPAYEPLTF